MQSVHHSGGGGHGEGGQVQHHVLVWVCVSALAVVGGVVILVLIGHVCMWYGAESGMGPCTHIDHRIGYRGIHTDTHVPKAFPKRDGSSSSLPSSCLYVCVCVCACMFMGLFVCDLGLWCVCVRADRGLV